MQHIIHFLIRNKYFLLFLFLELIAISLTIQSHSFHRSKLINSSNVLVGTVYNNLNSWSNYLYLKTFNEELLEENTRLKNLVSASNTKKPASVLSSIDSLVYKQKYNYIAANIIKNSYSKANNRLTINRGKKDGVIPELGVVSSKGIIGIVTNVSSSYAVVMSVINEITRINAKLKNKTHYGTISWNGDNYNIVQLEDLPIQTNIKVGDTIVTGGRSTIFPEGILIGAVKEYEIGNNKYSNINIQLFNDMSAIYHINVITNMDKQEIKELENE